MAADSAPYSHSLLGAPCPLVVPGLVQAGTTAIEKGELCTYNETSGYWIPISAAADILYLLGFAAMEIDANSMPAAGYGLFTIPRPGDVFSIPMAAAASLVFGANYEPTGSVSQTATLDADGDPVFNSAGFDNYPVPGRNSGTTVMSNANGLFTMNPAYSYYRLLQPESGQYMKVYTVLAADTLQAEWSGAVIVNTGATASITVNLPQDCRKGVHFHFANDADVDLVAVSAGGGISIKGAKSGDNKAVTTSDIGDFAHYVCLGANDWIAIGSISGADGDITVAT